MIVTKTLTFEISFEQSEIFQILISHGRRDLAETYLRETLDYKLYGQSDRIQDTYIDVINDGLCEETPDPLSLFAICDGFRPGDIGEFVTDGNIVTQIEVECDFENSTIPFLRS